MTINPGLPDKYRVDPAEDPVITTSDHTTGISYSRKRTTRRRQDLTVRFPLLRSGGVMAVREHYDTAGGGIPFEIEVPGRGTVIVIYTSPPRFTPKGPKHWTCAFTCKESFH